MLDVARRRRRMAAPFAGAAGVLLLLAIPLQLHAEGSEGVQMGDIASYPMGAAALLALIGAWLALRSAGDVRHGVDGAIVMLALVVVLGVLGAVAGLFTPALYNVGHEACLAGGSKVMLGATAIAGACGNVIPDSDFPSFYPGALAGALAVVAALVSIALLVRAHVPRGQAG